MCIKNVNTTSGDGPELKGTPCSVYHNYRGDFAFNDLVCIEALIGVPVEKRAGRLVQVRKGCGQFGSDQYFVRLLDGSLAAFENVMIRHARDRSFEDAFCRSNGRQPPVIPDQPECDGDTPTTEYSLNGEWPERGFVVEKPKQPETPGFFSMAVVTE